MSGAAYLQRISQAVRHISRPALPENQSNRRLHTVDLHKSVSLPSNRACLHRERCLPVRFGASKNMRLVQPREENTKKAGKS